MSAHVLKTIWLLHSWFWFTISDIIHLFNHSFSTMYAQLLFWALVIQFWRKQTKPSLNFPLTNYTKSWLHWCFCTWMRDWWQVHCQPKKTHLWLGLMGSYLTHSFPWVADQIPRRRAPWGIQCCEVSGWWDNLVFKVLVVQEAWGPVFRSPHPYKIVGLGGTCLCSQHLVGRDKRIPGSPCQPV